MKLNLILFFTSFALWSIFSHSSVFAASNNCGPDLEAKISFGARAGQHTTESLMTSWVHGLAKQYKLIGFLIEASPRSSEAQVFKAYLSELKDQGVGVVYDADTHLAPLIKEVMGRMSIGITGGLNYQVTSSEEAPLIPITNPYLRLQIFSKLNYLVTSTDSIPGFGVLLHNPEAVSFVYSPLKIWTNPSQYMLPRSFFSRLYSLFSGRPNSGRELRASSALKALRNQRKFLGLTANLESMPWEQLEKTVPAKNFEDAAEHGPAHAEALQTLDSLSRPGAVIFGSGAEWPEYSSLVDGVVRRLAEHGLPIVTGGAGGFMEVANRAAKEAGGISIGIPMAKTHQLETEKESATRFHTLTVPARGYESRIDLLLKNKEIIIIAPGGPGTRRELAAAIFYLAAQDPVSVPAIYFLSSKYYGQFYKEILASPLGVRLQFKLHLINKPEEMSLIGIP